MIKNIVEKYCPNLSDKDQEQYITEIQGTLNTNNCICRTNNNKYYALLEHFIIKQAEKKDKKVIDYKITCRNNVNSVLRSHKTINNEIKKVPGFENAKIEFCGGT